MHTNVSDFIFESATEYQTKISTLEEHDNILKMKFEVFFNKKCVPSPVVLKWTYPCKNVVCQWNPQLWSQRVLNPQWMPTVNTSRSAEGVPIQTHISLDGKNAITVAVADCLTPMEIATGIIEETAEISYKLTFFTKPVSAMNHYETEIWIDTRDVSYIEAISDTRGIWSKWGTSDNLPNEATLPMYSTWYSFHQDLEHRTLVEELKLAKEYGMETVIVDDGWQTEDGRRGYAYCGDWESIKIKNMKKLVKDIHAIGMKYMMWYGVPLVGKYSKAWERFEGKFLDKYDEKHPWRVLDPRYPDVREYLINTYERAVIEWDLDGLKLDFINNMQLTNVSNSPCDDMDYASLEDAICILLSEIRNRLSNIKPNILIEFRQPYIGPIMNMYGNMVRVADCPIDVLKNRAGIFDLRTISKNCAVHSDMVMWNYDDEPEAAALQIINIFFGVPQISMLIERLSVEHKKMLRFYINLWKQNRDCILNGKLEVQNPEAGYSFAFSSINDCIVAVSYIKNVLEINKAYRSIVFINGSWAKKLYIENESETFEALFIIRNCTGEKVEQGSIKIEQGTNSFQVPKSGVIELTRQ